MRDQKNTGSPRCGAVCSRGFRTLGVRDADPHPRRHARETELRTEGIGCARSLAPETRHVHSAPVPRREITLANSSHFRIALNTANAS